MGGGGGGRTKRVGRRGVCLVPVVPLAQPRLLQPMGAHKKLTLGPLWHLIWLRRVFLGHGLGWVQAKHHSEQLRGSSKVLAYMLREWKARRGQLAPLDDLRKCVRSLRGKVRGCGAYGEGV